MGGDQERIPGDAALPERIVFSQDIWQDVTPKIGGVAGRRIEQLPVIVTALALLGSIQGHKIPAILACHACVRAMAEERDVMPSPLEFLAQFRERNQVSARPLGNEENICHASLLPA